MPRYRRVFVPGGTHFFTVATNARQSILTTRAGRRALSYAFNKTRRLKPFDVVAFCLLPDHIHCIWQLPEGVADFRARRSAIKSLFTRRFRDLAECGGMRCRPTDGCTDDEHSTQSMSRETRGIRPVWQKRFREHMIRNDDDLRRHVDYIHYNPVKHGLAACAADWKWSTFGQYVKDGIYPLDWGLNHKDSIATLDTARE